MLDKTRRELTLVEIADKVINPGQAVILKSNQANILLKRNERILKGGTGDYAQNVLSGFDKLSDRPTNQGTIYTMGALDTDGDGVKEVGFYRLKDSVTTLKARRAYLAIPAGSEAGIRIRFDGDDTATGIDEVQSTIDKVQSATIYDLQGRRVVNPTKGIYIVNGKKVYMK
jgi:hypothetical protein